MSDYVCPYCRLGSDASAPACPNCGAPVDVREVRDSSGWVEQPAIKDQARIQFGRSHCQIAGSYVPMAEMDLAQGDSVYFSHHVLLWTEPSTQLAARPIAKPAGPCAGGGWQAMPWGWRFMRRPSAFASPFR